MSMTVSILLSVFNGERFLRQAVDSLLTQTYRDFELWIVNDASTDQTPQILDQLSREDSRVRIITNERNLGLTKSLNLALAQAQGSSIARMDADDIALPERLEKQVAYLDAHPDIDVVGTAYQFINAQNRVIGERHPSTDDEQIRRKLIIHNPFLHSSVLIRRALLDQVHGYDERFRRAQDYDLWMRLEPLTKLANLPNILMQKRFTTDMISYASEREQIKTAVTIRVAAIRRGQYPWWCAIYLIKPFLATILPLPLVRFLRTHVFGQKIYAHPFVQK